MLNPTLSSSLVEQLAIRLGYQKTIAKYTRKGYAVVVRGLSPNNTRRLVIPPGERDKVSLYEFRLR